MREYIDIYTQNQQKIETFVEDSIESLVSISNLMDGDFKKLFQTFPSLELIYIVDSATQKQLSSNVYRNKYDDNAKNQDRSYMLEKLDIKENGFAFSQPYQSSATSNICITVTKKEGSNIIFMDLVLEVLLERMGLIEKHKSFSNVIKSFYFIAGYFMMFLACVAIYYGAHDFILNLIHNTLSIDTIFKPIISATLGLAIFDLSKTVLEQEVYYKSYVKDSKIEIKTLTKFLVTILIALSIETLMVVFKIAIENYDKMLNALYLMMGTSLFILSLSVLIYMTKKKN